MSTQLPRSSPTRSRSGRLPSLTETSKVSKQRPPKPRRASIAGLTPGAPKAQRTSKTSQKLVVLPSAPQTRPLHNDSDQDLIHGYETHSGVRERKSEGERMSKEQRKRAGYKRITAYCVAELFKMKLLTTFLKREHNVLPRVFDEALYVMYHLPLLPGYGPNSNIRSSAPRTPFARKSILTRLSEAEENGYQGTYFTSAPEPSSNTDHDGYISSSSPVQTRKILTPMTPSEIPFSPASEREPPTPSSSVDALASEAEPFMSDAEPLVSDAQPVKSETETEVHVRWRNEPKMQSPSTAAEVQVEENLAEVVFFEYGVVVFFGLDEGQEKGILEDIENAGIMKRKIDEDDWEVEECHFSHDPQIAYPRIYNDFFTLKSHSHLLKLSIAHALAQSTLLAHYESNAARVLSSPLTLSIPTQLARSGRLQLRRHEALKLTGRLFKLRRDVNLVSNVLDVPELFWSEASLKELYDAVREYMEIKGRVQVLNEKLGVAGDFLDAIHDHLNNSAMSRITWIIIWLIVVAILVELGEIVARLVVHATMGSESIVPISKEEALRTLERMMIQS